MKGNVSLPTVFSFSSGPSSSSSSSRTTSLSPRRGLSPSPAGAPPLSPPLLRPDRTLALERNNEGEEDGADVALQPCEVRESDFLSSFLSERPRDCHSSCLSPPPSLAVAALSRCISSRRHATSTGAEHLGGSFQTLLGKKDCPPPQSGASSSSSFPPPFSLSSRSACLSPVPVNPPHHSSASETSSPLPLSSTSSAPPLPLLLPSCCSSSSTFSSASSQDASGVSSSSSDCFLPAFLASPDIPPPCLTALLSSASTRVEDSRSSPSSPIRRRCCGVWKPVAPRGKSSLLATHQASRRRLVISAGSRGGSETPHKPHRLSREGISFHRRNTSTVFSSAASYPSGSACSSPPSLPTHGRSPGGSVRGLEKDCETEEEEEEKKDGIPKNRVVKKQRADQAGGGQGQRTTTRRRRTWRRRRRKRQGG